MEGDFIIAINVGLNLHTPSKPYTHQWIVALALALLEMIKNQPPDFRMAPFESLGLLVVHLYISWLEEQISAILQ